MWKKKHAYRLKAANHLFWIGWLAVFIVTGCATTPKAPTQAPGKPKPYRVAGKWYQPVSHAKGFQQRGIASWYGKKFHGRKTSNGETYDMYAMTAAHKTLPLGTYVHVRNLDNDTEVTVRINDRGPFVQGRIIDLSYTAAKKIDIATSGTAPVVIVALEPGNRQTPKSKDKPEQEPIDYYKGNFTFQIGAFSDKQNALRLKEKLNQTYKNAHVSEYDNGQEMLYRVRVGKASSLEQAVAYEKTLIQHGFKDVFIVAE
ncbi:septal ring lytic transglycosylase RlpA family protein [Thermodesulfobacteriota bacterium]